MLEIYHKRNPPLIAKAKSEANSNKRKTCISPRSRRKLVREFYISKKCSRKERYIFAKYSRKLNISQIIF